MQITDSVLIIFFLVWWNVKSRYFLTFSSPHVLLFSFLFHPASLPVTRVVSPLLGNQKPLPSHVREHWMLTVVSEWVSVMVKVWCVTLLQLASHCMSSCSVPEWTLRLFEFVSIPSLNSSFCSSLSSSLSLYFLTGSLKRSSHWSSEVKLIESSW